MNRTDLHPIEALILAALAVADALLTLLVAVLALLLTLAGWHPTKSARSAAYAPLQQPSVPLPVESDTPAVMPASEPLPVACSTAAPLLPMLEALSVDELRQEARRLGIPRRIVRSLRKADLLPAIAGAAMAPC